MFLFGFTTAIAIFSIINTFTMYKAKKKRKEEKKQLKEDEEEFQRILEKAFGLEPDKPKKPGSVLSIVRDDDDEPPLQ